MVVLVLVRPGNGSRQGPGWSRPGGTQWRSSLQTPASLVMTGISFFGRLLDWKWVFQWLSGCKKRLNDPKTAQKWVLDFGDLPFMDQSRLLLRQIQFPNCQRSIDTNTSSHFYVCKRVRLNLLKSYWSIKEKFYYNDWWTVKCSNEDMGRWLSWSTSQNNYSSFSINFSQSAQSSLWGRPGTPPGCSPPPPPPPRGRGSADP